MAKDKKDKKDKKDEKDKKDKKGDQSDKKAKEKEKKRLKKEKAAAKKRLKLARKELAKELKEQHRLQDIFSERNAEETRKLIMAASSGWTPSVERHLAAGGSVNDMADTGTTALISAARWGHIEVLQVLLSAGADPNVLNDPDQGGCTALWKAASANEIGALHTLLNAGANPDIQNYLGDTPLAFAARENYLEIVQILLAAGADPDVQNKHGWTAMHGAVLEGHVLAAKLLLAYGCGDHQDEHGEFLYEFALARGREVIAEMLRVAGAVKPAIDPRSLMEKSIRLREPIPLKRTLFGFGKKRGCQLDTGKVVDYEKTMFGGFRFRVQFECEARNLPKKRRGFLCCAKKSTDYNFTKLEKRLRLMRRGQKGRRFEIIDKLLGPTTVVGHTDELLRQPKQATLLLQLPP